MALYIMDRQNNFIKNIGSIVYDDIRSLTNLAKKHHLKCASYIDFVGHTIFNQKQLITLKKDMQRLSLLKEINNKVVELFLTGIEVCQQNKDYYLIFVGA